MNLKKCKKCKKYSIKDICENCNIETKEAHYKFIKIKDAPKSKTSIVRRK